MTGSSVCALRCGVIVLCAVVLMLAAPAADAQLQPAATGLRSAGSATGLKMRSAEDGHAGTTGTFRFGGWRLSYGGFRDGLFQAQEDASLPSSLYPPRHVLSGNSTFSLQAESHWGNFRGAYIHYNGPGDALHSRNGHRFQLNYHYTGRSSFGLAYSEGREFDNFGAAQGFAGAEIRNWSLGGQHWLTPSWALTYRLVNQEPSGYYRRQGLRLGIRHDF